MVEKKNENKIVIYVSPDKNVRLDIEVEKDTVWLSNEQITRFLMSKGRQLLNA